MGRTALCGTNVEVEAVFRKASGGQLKTYRENADPCLTFLTRVTTVAVNHIAQSGPRVAIASCTVGDNPSG